MFWIWHPYTARKITRFHSLYGLLFTSRGVGRKLLFILSMLIPKPVRSVKD